VCVCRSLERQEMRTQFRSENVKDRGHLRDLGIDGRITLCGS
jgi:hypothetical protein